MIRVLIVDDSITTRRHLRHIIESDPGLFVAGEAQDGMEAVTLVERLRPDLVLMDIQMPQMDGYEATRIIMERCPVPIVIHSSIVTPQQSENIFEAMQAGAVAVVAKPPGLRHPEYGCETEKLLATIKLMAEVKVVGRTRCRGGSTQRPGRLTTDATYRTKVIGIGASTGGPEVLKTILSILPRDYPVPVLVTQHIARGFLEGMLYWLGKNINIEAKIGKTGDRLRPGSVFFAPETEYLEITPDMRLRIVPHQPGNQPFRPITRMFSSMARCLGKKCTGVLLTGMGDDGAVGLLRLKEAGAVTIAQDRESCVVFGMPKEAIQMGAAQYVLSPKEIGDFLLSHTLPVSRARVKV